ncbi:MAG: nicotinamide riboside transporter PnuC [Chakrabartia sp.]
MSVLEFIAALFGVVNIVLIAKRSVWNFSAALVMVTLTAIVLWDVQLYSDAGLQLFFFIVNLIGWGLWVRHKGVEGEVIVARLGLAGQMTWIVAALLAIWGWGWFMAMNTNASYPWWDASVAMLSVVAQILMTRRYINNWHWWVVVNLISIGLYWHKQLYWFTGLYVLFLGMAIWGLIEWRRAEARQRAAAL